MLVLGEDGSADDAFHQGKAIRGVPAGAPFGVPLWRMQAVVAWPDDETPVLPF